MHTLLVSPNVIYQNVFTFLFAKFKFLLKMSCCKRKCTDYLYILGRWQDHKSVSCDRKFCKISNSQIPPSGSRDSWFWSTGCKNQARGKLAVHTTKGNDSFYSICISRRPFSYVVLSFLYVQLWRYHLFWLQWDMSQQMEDGNCVQMHATSTKGKLVPSGLVGRMD